MPTFSIENFGCRATEADAAALRRELLAGGLTLADEHSSADMVVLNTCTVTAAADSQAREAVRKIHRANPEARIVVTGCYAQRAPEELAAIPGVAWVVGNSHQAEIPEIVRGLGIARGKHRFCFRGGSRRRTHVAGARPGKNSDWRYLRAIHRADRACLADGGRPHAAHPENSGWLQQSLLLLRDSVCSRAQPQPAAGCRGRRSTQARASGAKEIVLSGINLGSYGRDLAPRAALADVVERILDETDLEQLRFSSIEPQDVTEDFVALVASSDRLAPHFHVPLQSGSDRILRAMHRWYRTEHYAERISLIRRLLPDAAIGADVIVGFPGETDEDFQATVEFIERLPFTYLHVFSFSARPGTAAAALGDPVPLQTIRERARALRELSQRKSPRSALAQTGRTLRALTLAALETAGPKR